MIKLIRDKIPEICKEQESALEIAELKSDSLYNHFLREKLIEEVTEYLEAESLEEIVDIFTVLTYILSSKGISQEEFEKAYTEKLDQKGGFDKRLIGFFKDKPQD